jgi:hypothetical protein
MRLLPWCQEHAPSVGDVAARDVESALLSAYAVDPVSDEMIRRIGAGGTERSPRERPPRRAAIAAAIAAAAIGLVAIAVLVQPGADPSSDPAPVGTFVGMSGATGSNLGQPATRAGGLLTNYPPIRIVLDTNVPSPICGHIGGGDVRIVDCRPPEGVNAYVFATAPTGTRRFETCTRRADAVTTRGGQTLCWRRLAVTP